MNTKYKVNLYVFVGYVCWLCYEKEREKRKKNRKKKKTETIKQSSMWKRAADSKLEQAARKSEFKEASLTFA